MPGDKLYFPPHPHPTIDLLHAYSWSPRRSIDPHLVTYYSNPFKSIYAVPSIYQIYDLAQSPTHQMYRALVDIERIDKSTGEVVEATKKTPFRYIVVDKNYLWSDLYPHFLIDEFINSFHVYKRIGNILILENTPFNSCSLDNKAIQSICHQVRQLNRLEAGVASHQILTSQVKVHQYLSFIMMPEERLRLRRAKILTSTYVKVVPGGQKDVFDFSSIRRSNLVGTILIPLLVNESSEDVTSGIVVAHDKSTPISISAISTEKTHISYVSVPFDAKRNSHLEIGTFGDQPVTFIANPFFVSVNQPVFE